MNFLVVFLVFLGVLALLMLWSYFMCPHVVKTIEYYKQLIEEYKRAEAEQKRKQDNDNRYTDLEKWY